MGEVQVNGLRQQKIGDTEHAGKPLADETGRGAVRDTHPHSPPKRFDSPDIQITQSLADVSKQLLLEELAIASLQCQLMIMDDRATHGPNNSELGMLNDEL